MTGNVLIRSNLPNSDAGAKSAIASTPEVNSSEVYRQPNGRPVCRVRHPVRPLSGDQHMVAGPEVALIFALDAKPGQAGKE